MTQDSSNNTEVVRMERLQNIQKVQAPEGLYERILSKVEEQKTDIVPLHWVKVAAAIIILFISADVLVLMKSSKTSVENELRELVPNSSTQLYYE